MSAPSPSRATPPVSRREVPLVIGCGNDHRRDDGCGRAAARSLRPLLGGRARLVESDGEATNLLDLWDEQDLVIVVDAVRSGRAPGTVQRIEVGEGPLPASVSTGSTHGFSLAEGVALGRSLGRFPNRLVIYGIEAGDLEMGAGLTPAVAEAVENVVARIDREIPGSGGAPNRPTEAAPHA